MNDKFEHHNKLLGMLITQANNDINQFYEIKYHDEKGQELIDSSTPTLSRQSLKIIEAINFHATAIYNEIYYPMLQSECSCGLIHNHNGYSKLGAQLMGSELEISMHYLLEPFTRTRLSWNVTNKIDEDIPEYITIKINLLANRN